MTKPLFDVFRAVMLENPDDSRKAALDAFVARMKADPAYLEILARDYFDRMAAVWVVRAEGKASVSLVRTEVAQDKAERISQTLRSRAPQRSREEQKAEVAKIYDRMKASLRVVLLDLQLPDGTALRNATGAQCAKAQGFFGAVAKHVGPTQVVDKHLTESDLQNIRARFFLKNMTEKGAA